MVAPTGRPPIATPAAPGSNTARFPPGRPAPSPAPQPPAPRGWRARALLAADHTGRVRIERTTAAPRHHDQRKGLFRLGIVSLFVVVALDVVVAWALCRVFGPVSTGISLLAAWFRLVYAGVLLVAVSHLVEVLRLLGDDQYRAAFNTDQLQAQALSGIHSFGEVLGAGLLLFGLHLLVVGYLAYRSGYVPRVLAMVLTLVANSCS